MSSQDVCFHCNLPISPADLVVDEMDGQEMHFCCHGCQGVYRIISGAGLGQYYKRRKWDEDGVPSGAYESSFDEASLAGHVTYHNDRLAEISLIIEGIRCASCVWLLEKLLTKEPGISFVRVNYGTHRAQVRFNPEETTPAQIFSTISRCGYSPHPFSSDAIQESAAREQRSLLIRFGTAAFLSMQVMAFSFALYGGYFHGIEPATQRLLQFFAALVTTPVVFYSGWPFFSGAWRSLAHRTASMDLLIAIGVGTAYIYSIYSLLTGGEVYFETAAMIITLILLGRLLESSARTRSISAIDKLLRLAPESAHKVVDGATVVVASSSLVPGDIIIVKPGERVPVDGIITEGTTELDESTLTGEPMPVVRKPDELVSAGSFNLTSTVTLQVKHSATESFIARMARLVEEAQNRIAPIQSLADQVAGFFVPVVIFIAIGTWGYWFMFGDNHADSLLYAVAVLIVACPCALGLATPTAVLAASANAAARGILFRGGDILEMAARVQLVVFDKTGTLTYGRPTVKKIIPAGSYTEIDLLTIACRAEAGSNHPLAKSILAYAKAAGVIPSAPKEVMTIPGRGIKTETAEGLILVGNKAFLEEHGVAVEASTTESLTEVHVSCQQSYYGTLLIHDAVREDASVTLAKLQRQGLQTVLLTGDNHKTAEQVCSELAISVYSAEMSPADKSDWIRKRQENGDKVMMVGDGINDAPALALADVGCAMAGGTDIALETSDLVLAKPRLKHIYEAVFIARKTLRVIRQNLFWAFTYNLITIPLAACGKLAPVWAAVAMATSSLLVVSNSFRLGRLVRKTFSVANDSASN